MIVAGELLPLRNVDQRIALVEDAEVGVGREAVIHEAPGVAVEDDHAGHFQMGVGIAPDIVLHGQRKRVELAHVYEDVELGIKTPHETSALYELASEDPDALNGARRKISADHQHLYASWFASLELEKTRLPGRPAPLARHRHAVFPRASAVTATSPRLRLKRRRICCLRASMRRCR